MEIYIYVMQATAIKELEWLHHQTKLTLKQQKNITRDEERHFIMKKSQSVRKL